ncbi:RNA polymerase sigma factor [Hyphomonas oceanitis]|uniref:RNA polymerase sigma-e factor protein n=1 Tax=Hyphomonas oceanitis SCH89 TaxID=1280953 RepID=A0A059G5L7_9PROT|nr:sigma-70 family RNA polymerase sigma factor [Hyphomonas oceanitis]KDA01865.1 RNA polymerase sigma-e factor protein [Hyphomonas oceanitis SCH89]
MSLERDRENECLRQALLHSATGDRSAFSTVHELTAPRFTLIVMGIVKCEETTGDVLQRAYLSIWQNAAKYDSERANPFTWMLVIMRNRAIDALRARTRSHDTQELDEAVEDDGPRPETAARFEQAGRLLTEKINDLPTHMGTAIMLQVVHGYTCREIGDRLNQSPHTVKSWIRRGLVRLRNEMPYATIAAAI